MQELETTTDLTRFAQNAIQRLREVDPELHAILEDEYRRQANVLTMVASSSIADPAALICEAMPTMNVTAEGYPGNRFHAGCKHIDRIEQLAIDRAKACFGAQYANVQPMSATSANEVVMFSVMKPGDTLLGLELDSGGHLTHGSKASISGQVFDAVGYGLTKDEVIDYDQMRERALEHRPKLIICGTTAYSRTIDWARFRAVADEVGAFLLADITHIAGLVAAGLHPSPVDHAHFTTMCTHKQMYGGRGGLILIGKDYEMTAPGSKLTLAQMVQKRVFPYFQGAPNQSQIAAKARGLAYVASPEFKQVAQRVVELARALSDAFLAKGYRVVFGGTDNHIVVVDVAAKGVSGVNAEKALEDCGIVVNKNRIPYDQRPPTVTSGIRLGTNGLAIREMEPADMAECVDLIHEVLQNVSQVSDKEYELEEGFRSSIEERVRAIARRRPIRTYPAPL
ncbi:MAG TPA: serine hydroxymethyltransferase [Planctomycetes bacterium]|nr:serine hydroxymethyltransferase [Planctomycetota bacterium]